MGLFGKIKNILFDEEEIEIPIEDKKPKVKKEEKKLEKEFLKEEVEAPHRAIEQVVEMEEEEEKTPTLEDKYASLFDDKDDDFIEVKNSFKERDEDLIPRINEDIVPPKKEQPSFHFPMDVNDNDFTIPSRQTKTNVVTVEKENHSNYDKYIITKKEETVVEKKFFKNSPIISPVYGIMDKNYKKEDIQEKPRKQALTREQKKSADVEAVRKKAFGTLEDEIESTLDKSIDDFYNKKDTQIKTKSKNIETLDDELTQPIKSIDDLLIDSMNDNSEKGKDKFEKASDLNETFKLDEVINEMKKTSNNLSTDDDLFKLIDSMYEERDDH